MTYEVVLDGQYDVTDTTADLTMEESIEEVSVRITANFLKVEGFPDLLGGEDVRISGPFFQSSVKSLLFKGVAWEVEDQKRGGKQVSLTAYDRTIYMAKSEDEYLFSSGGKASSRIKKYASDWGIPLGEIADTSVSLAKAVYRAQPIYRMIQQDLAETSDKGGELFIPRIDNDKLHLVEIGSNSEVWLLESTEEVTRSHSLENAVTKVKVLGKEEENKRTSVLATVTKDTGKYGTIQKVLQDSKVKTKSDAEKAGRKMLSGPEETVTVRTFDINVIRAGDQVRLDDRDLFVISVKRTLAPGGMMTLSLGDKDMIRRKYYGESI
ncbi:phage portal protein [Halobacillus trueperi]|uniref:Phage portal protein n=1 Tax=Halobacillus trueperi TaxID=156205 RepID=A0A3D8VLN6_9BACI|nr:phage portal protein [Halobacillus trueperi]RDY70326.1 phage portal protein [Halobacillus trueperi]